MARKHHPERSESIRKLIIDSALQICLDKGYNEVTVRRIGDQIGYSTGVIYYHFKDKQDILDHLDRKLDEETFTTVNSILKPENSLEENLSKLCDYTCEMAYYNPEVYKRVFTSSRIENNPQTKDLWVKLIHSCLISAAERGDLPDRDLYFKAKSLLSYILGHNFLFFELDRPDDINEAKRFGKATIGIVINGILK